MESKSFYTPQSAASMEISVKGSRFIATLDHTSSKEEADEILNKVAAQNPSATHNCFAYRLGIGDDGIFRVEDDGEPGNTAGKPILQALEARNVSNAMLVVTRYFGGTKLGIGGLIRAYSAAAFAALDACKLALVEPTSELAIIFPYDATGIVHKVLNQFNCTILETNYGARTSMSIELPLKNRKPLQVALRDMTRGEISIE